jgi:flagellin
MTTINTNVSSLIAKNAIGQNERAMSQAMTRLSTGSRINSARDDAAGLAISDRMSSQISGLNMAARNANDAVSLIQTAEGATKEISSMLGRMRELAVQAASDTYTSSDRAALDLEFDALMAEVDRIAANTEWNGTAILSGNGALETALEVTKDYAIQIGADATQTMDLNFKSWRTKVARDSLMSDGVGTAKVGLDAQTGDSQIVTFAGTVAGGNGTVIVGGLTLTFSDGTTPAQIAAAFAGLSAGSSGPGVSGQVTAQGGALTGFSTAATSDATVTFTQIATGSTKTNSLTGLSVAVTGTHKSNAGSSTAVAAATGGVDNQSAYNFGNAGILFYGTTPTQIDITSQTTASEAITQIDAAINGSAAERAKLGSYMSRLQHASDNLTNIATNTAASRSQIADADYAAETTELARTQIISQASTAMLAQANQVKQSVLALLR